ncbi:glycolate oxidase iron-sulfur subunit [Methylomonas koyamae]|uniref:Glycolate oxidase iron-sulfur subunit n=1 Tax=Methylomonas koyamae TaxID=702114 RepID=A0A177N475_9GAMM|nr:glycolate oxidase subunit GlcF [Methylomonas koyamae]OAI12464.1 glycolate oxidase iron-sulfur subunit [Methylomonas koyamae]
MQTQIDPSLAGHPDIASAQTALQRCVHCGFCNAACPTYRLQGDELDGPRGRIYLIKQLLEGQAATASTQHHLDRCLSCRACESACPSGVEYGRLLDAGRAVAAGQLRRPWRQRWLRRALLTILPYPRRLAPLVALARLAKPLLPAVLQAKIPAKPAPETWPPLRHRRRMLMLQGCVQPALAPGINAAAARVLDRLGISVIQGQSGCCGALAHHLDQRDAALDAIRRRIDAWWPALQAGAEAIVITASGCGTMVKDYAYLLRDDPDYADKAARVAAAAKDIAEIVQAEDTAKLAATPRKIAFQAPCSLQHGQALAGVVESLLAGLGFELTPVADAGLCCGSAGSYSLLQPELSNRLRQAKLLALQAEQPELIATANIGCLLHLRETGQVPVRHWIELLDGPNR